MSEKLLIAFFYLLIISCDNKDAIKPVTDLKDVSDSSSYALGADLGENLKKQYVELDYDAFLTGLRFGYDKGNVPLLTKDERKDAFQKLQASIRNKQQEQSNENLKLAEEFLEKNKISDSDIKETPTGLQYRVVREGTVDPLHLWTRSKCMMKCVYWMIPYLTVLMRKMNRLYSG